MNFWGVKLLIGLFVILVKFSLFLINICDNKLYIRMKGSFNLEGLRKKIL